MNNIPNEVIWASMLMQMNSSVGQDIANKVYEIIKKYPKYFPWETKYNEIPEEVHLQFREELLILQDRFFPSPSYSNKGLYHQLREIAVHQPLITPEYLRESFEAMKANGDKHLLFTKEKKKLWNKIYSKYKLKYRE